MSVWTNAPWSFMPGSDRLLGPVRNASSAAYAFGAANTLIQDAVAFGTDAPIYVLKPVAPGGPPSTPLMPPRVLYLFPRKK